MGQFGPAFPAWAAWAVCVQLQGDRVGFFLRVCGTLCSTLGLQLCLPYSRANVAGWLDSAHSPRAAFTLNVRNLWLAWSIIWLGGRGAFPQWTLGAMGEFWGNRKSAVEFHPKSQMPHCHMWGCFAMPEPRSSMPAPPHLCSSCWEHLHQCLSLEYCSPAAVPYREAAVPPACGLCNTLFGETWAAPPTHK